MSGWILVGACGGLVSIGLYLMWTVPPIDPHNYFMPRDCTEDCEHCTQDNR
jgi:hypothetical protein